MGNRILIVEDERDIVEMLKLRLEENGYEITVAYDGRIALEKARSERPDLILLDYTLPKVKGDEVCRQLKSEDECKNIQIILLSAYREEQISEEKIADAFIGKPYLAEDLLKKIKELIP